MVTEGLAAKIIQLGEEALDGEIVQRSKEVILDTIGVTLAGSRTDSAKLFQAYAASLESPIQATVLGSGIRSAPVQAALANAACGHVLDFDDVSWTNIGHPAVVVLYAALAAGEAVEAGGRDLIQAFVIGYETIASIARGTVPDLCQRGWHSTSTIGVFGAAAAAGYMLRLDHEQMIQALGIAGSLAAGVKANFGTMTKHLHAGQASANGVFAAQMARDGLTACRNILEADQGFCHVFAPQCALSQIVDRFGQPFDLLGEGAILKKWPSCYSTHPCIEAALFLAEEYQVRPGEIERIDIGMTPYALDILFYNDPQTGYEAKFSNQYCAAVSLARKKVTLAEFAPEAVADPEIRELVRRATVYIDQELSEGQYFLPPDQGPSRTRLTVTLKKGTRYVKEVRFAKGSAQRRLSWPEITDKFRSCAGHVLCDSKIDQVIETIMSLERAQAIRPLTALLC